jgi:hypothetical protein
VLSERAHAAARPSLRLTARRSHSPPRPCGPVISRLLIGRLFGEIGKTHQRIDAGEAWFESDLQTVVGHTLAPASAFFRCMVLDLELLGRLTFRPAQPEGAAKPRGVGHRRFFDTIVTLPR